MTTSSKMTLGLSAVLLAATASAEITFYEHEGFRGRAFSTSSQVNDFQRRGFNDRASSAIVSGGQWRVCNDSNFRGQCTVLRNGSYDSLTRMGINDRISSAQPVDSPAHYDNASPEPLSEPNYEFRRRPNEHLQQARITSSHAVVGPPEQRCWVEREQVRDGSRGDRNVTGGVVGALIGGVLGHQIGSGNGRTAATAGGVIAGAAIGSNQGRGSNGTTERDVRRCETTSNNSAPEYWDVTYNYRGVEHRAQVSSPPGQTIAVNRNGEPRL